MSRWQGWQGAELASGLRGPLTMPIVIHHKYRGHIVSKYDSGPRRMGRDVSYSVADMAGDIVCQAFTLAGAKAALDWHLDATPEDRARAAQLAQELTGGK